MQQFRDKVAVITGAASGIGRGIAERCVSEGMRVVLADVDEATLTKAETELKDQGGTVLGVRTDVSKRSDVEQLARQAFDAFGQVNLLFNNAGVAAGGAPWEATWNDWEWVIGVNLWGVIHGVKVFTPLMIAQNTECHIINTSSGAGLIGGWRLRSLRGDEACGGSPLRKPVLSAPTTEPARQSFRSLPRACADRYHQRGASQARGVA